MVAAPILVGEDRYICVVEVIKNLKEQRLYVHEAFLTKNLQEVVASSHVRDSNDATSRQPQGEVANVLINHLKNNIGVSGSGKSQLTDNNKTDKNESKNMNRKNTIRLTESELKNIITESVKKILKEEKVLRVQYDDNVSFSKGRKYYYCPENGRYYTNIEGEWYICTDNYYLEPDVHVDPSVKIITESISGYDSETDMYHVSADEVRDIVRKLSYDLSDALQRLEKIREEERHYNDGNGNQPFIVAALKHIGNAANEIYALENRYF